MHHVYTASDPTGATRAFDDACRQSLLLRMRREYPCSAEA